MAEYAIIGLAKLKAAGNIKAVLEHMTRSRKTENSNGRANDVLIQPPQLPEIMDRIHSYLPRKNAVFAYDFLLTASPEFFQGKTEEEIHAWERDSLAWCRETFGSDNVIGAICHRDELTPHIQALIIPEKDGKLNARAYTGGRDKLRNLWTSYAKKMKPWGLQRGKLFSPAEHKAIKDYYTDVNKAAELAARGKIKPEQLPDPGIKDHANPRQYAADLINFVVKRLQQQNANLRQGLAAANREKESLKESTARDREIYALIKDNPDAFRKLQEALLQEQKGRTADKERYFLLLAAIKDYFRRNIDAHSVQRKPEALGQLQTFPELADAIRLDITPEPKPQHGITLDL